MSSTFEESLTDYETEVWHKYRMEAPLQRGPNEDLDAYWRCVWEKVANVWNWGVGLYEENGASRLGQEVENLKEDLDAFGVELPGEDEPVPLEEVRSNLREWKRLWNDAEEQVQAGNADEQIGKQGEERFNNIVACTTWGELLEFAELAISEREETLADGQEQKEMLQFRLDVYKELVKRAPDEGGLRRLSTSEAEGAEEDRSPSEKNPFEGTYHAGDYALKMKEMLAHHPSITSFSGLKAKILPSRVDTVKRAIGYDDLPTEEKEFPRFREMLFYRVANHLETT